MPDAPVALSRLIAAEGISNFGSMLSRLAISWLATLALAATPAQMALLLLADVAAAALASLLLAPWVDRSGKRAVMLRADGARAMVLGLLAIAAWQGSVSFGGLLVAAAASGVLTVAFELARSAWMAQSVHEAGLPRANAGLAMAGSVSEAVAFALGGWVYQGLGAVVAVAVDAASYIGSALCLRDVPEVAAAARPPVPAPALPLAGSRVRDWIDDMAAGVRAIGGRPPLRALAAVESLLAFGAALSATSFMIFVSRDLALPTGWLGMIFATGAFGSLLGAALAPGLGRRLGPGRAITLGLAAYTLGLACVPLAPTAGGWTGAHGSPSAAGWIAVALLLAQQVVGDAGHALRDVHDRTWRQTAVPVALLARADAGIRMMGHMATLAGAATGAAVGTWIDARAVLWLAVASAAAAAVTAARRLTRHAA